MSARRKALLLGIAWIGLTAFAWSRPPTPYQWDESELWLVRAAAETHGIGTIARCATTGWRNCPVSDSGRPEYPAAFPIAVGLAARMLPSSLVTTR